MRPQVTPGEKRLYQLKNKSLESRAKGHLILTLDVEYNPIRAAVRTVNPREPKVMFEPAKFKRAVRSVTCHSTLTKRDVISKREENALVYKDGVTL